MLTLPVRRGARLAAATAPRTGDTVPRPERTGPEPIGTGPSRTGRTGPFWSVLRGVGFVWTVTRSMLAKAWQDRILGLSAESAFWQLLSVGPLMIAVLGVLGYASRLTGSDLTDRTEAHALRLTARLVSPTVQHEVVTPIVTELLRHGRGGVATISIVAALWAGSSATATFTNTIAIAYGQRELRGAVASRLLALWIYVCTLVAAMFAAPLLILGPDFVVARLPESWHDIAEHIVRLLYWPLTGAIVFGALSAFYHYAPPLRLTWRRALPGAVLAMALFLALSWGLRFYIGRVGGSLLVFSTLAAPVVALLYFYVLAFAVLLGAELNGTLEILNPAGRRTKHRHRLVRLFRKLTGAPPKPEETAETGAAAAGDPGAEVALKTAESTAGPAPASASEAGAEPGQKSAHSPVGSDS